MSLLDRIHEGKFALVVECTPHNADEVRHVAEIAKGLVELNKKYAPHDLCFAAVSLTQNPGGNLSYDHQAALSILREQGFPEDEIELLPHVTGKDMNLDGATTLLSSLAERGVGTVLALTGDVPAGKGVFDLDSLGLLQLVKDVNLGILKRNRDAGSFAAAPQLTAGAAVGPFKYTEGSLAMQYIKASKKVHEGAAFLVCNSGWDANRSEQLIEAMRVENVPILGNCLVANEAAAKFMQSLPGVVITDEFLMKLKGESPDDALERAAQQLAMFRQLGYAGADLGKPGEFESAAQIEKLVDSALAIKDWREHKANLTFAPPESGPPEGATGNAGFSWGVHKAVFEEDGALHDVAKAVLTPFERSAQRDGALYHLFRAVEGFGKELAYSCEHCGDCFLPENEYICTMGHCEKGFSNPPCGDADPQGHCGNNPNRVCVGEKMYHRMLRRDTLETFRQRVLPPRRPQLRDSASVLNYFFGRDHQAKTNPLEGSGLVQVAELLHATIPFPGAAMRYIHELGPEGFERPNRGLLAVEYLIRSQAEQGADYIDINIDELMAPNAEEIMRQYVRLVQRWSGGTPPCIDSSDPLVLGAGLEEWFSLGSELRAPLLNSIPFNELDKRDNIFALRGKNAFSAICLLVGPEGPLPDAEAMHEAARTVWKKCREAGFRNEELFFDCVTLGIATDGCMDGMGMVKPSHTYHSFRAIERIRKDPEMLGCHAVLGVSNWVYGARKRRIGHIRAFIAAAQKRGLDAAIVDTEKQFGVVPAAPELVEFVEMFAGLDGSDDSMMTYSTAMQQARSGGLI